jgi:nicotinamidase-related amidase
MEKPVLVVIDMLHDFLGSWEATRRQKLVSSINELVGGMRSLGHAVVWVRQEFESDLRDAFPRNEGQRNTHYDQRNTGVPDRVGAGCLPIGSRHSQEKVGRFLRHNS